MILVFGSTGMLGHTLTTYLASKKISHRGISRENIDLSKINIENLENVILESGCNVVVNCAGLIPNRIPYEIDSMVKINTVLPLITAEICEKLRVEFIHITTDSVYDGITGDYDENSKPNPMDHYSITKYLGESKKSTTIRTSIIGEEKSNKLSLLEKMRSFKNAHFPGFEDHIWNGMTALQLSKVIEQIITEKIFWKGTRNIYSNKLTKLKLVNTINDIYELGLEIIPTNTGKSINRTLTSVYDNSTFAIPDIETQIIQTRLFHHCV